MRNTIRAFNSADFVLKGITAYLTEKHYELHFFGLLYVSGNRLYLRQEYFLSLASSTWRCIFSDMRNLHYLIFTVNYVKIL